MCGVACGGNGMEWNAMQCNAMQCNAMQCNAMQCNAATVEAGMKGDVIQRDVRGWEWFERRLDRMERWAAHTTKKWFKLWVHKRFALQKKEFLGGGVDP